jgi:hypothetical protein
MPFHHAIVTGLATSRGQQKHPNEVGPNQSAALRSDRRVGQIKMPPDPATQTPGPLQNAEPGPLQLAEITGAAWFLGMGSLLCRHRPALGAAAIAVGPFLVINAVGIMVDVEAWRFIGLTGTVLLAPAWAIGMGTSLLRAGDHRRTA